MKIRVKFKTTKIKYLDLSDMVLEVLKDEECTASFEMFLLNYLESKDFDYANAYDNWYEIEKIVYNNLFVYCAEKGLNKVLEILKEMKDF